MTTRSENECVRPDLTSQQLSVFYDYSACTYNFFSSFFFPLRNLYFLCIDGESRNNELIAFFFSIEGFRHRLPGVFETGMGVPRSRVAIQGPKTSDISKRALRGNLVA